MAQVTFFGDWLSSIAINVVYFQVLGIFLVLIINAGPPYYYNEFVWNHYGTEVPDKLLPPASRCSAVLRVPTPRSVSEASKPCLVAFDRTPLTDDPARQKACTYLGQHDYDKQPCIEYDRTEDPNIQVTKTHTIDSVTTETYMLNDAKVKFKETDTIRHLIV